MDTTTLAPPTVSRVVIIDDHPTIREGLAQHIIRLPEFEVCGMADDMDSALSLVERARPDVAVIDMVLKDSSGLELIKRLHESYPDVAILAWSMHEASLYGKRAVKAGASCYVSKMQPTEDVIAGLRSLLNGEPRPATVTPRRKPAGDGSVEDLSDRELQVLQMLGEGMNMAQITARTQLSPKTIETYRARIKQKLDLKSNAELMRHAVQFVIEAGKPRGV